MGTVPSGSIESTDILELHIRHTGGDDDNITTSGLASGADTRHGDTVRYPFDKSYGEQDQQDKIDRTTSASPSRQAAPAASGPGRRGQSPTPHDAAHPGLHVEDEHHIQADSIVLEEGEATADGCGKSCTDDR